MLHFCAFCFLERSEVCLCTRTIPKTPLHSVFNRRYERVTFVTWMYTRSLDAPSLSHSFIAQMTGKEAKCVNLMQHIYIGSCVHELNRRLCRKERQTGGMGIPSIHVLLLLVCETISPSAPFGSFWSNYRRQTFKCIGGYMYSPTRTRAWRRRRSCDWCYPKLKLLLRILTLCIFMWLNRKSLCKGSWVCEGIWLASLESSLMWWRVQIWISIAITWLLRCSLKALAHLMKASSMDQTLAFLQSKVQQTQALHAPSSDHWSSADTDTKGLVMWR